MDFEFCEEYLRSISNKMLWQCYKKNTFSSSCDFQIDKKINNVKKGPRKKLIQTLIFSKLPSPNKIVIRRNVM